jgi:hypothetical protein
MRDVAGATSRQSSEASPLSTAVTTAGATATYSYLAMTTTDPREFGMNLRVTFGSR